MLLISNLLSEQVMRERVWVWQRGAEGWVYWRERGAREDLILVLGRIL